MTGRNAHAFDKNRHVAGRRHLIDNSVIAARNVEQTFFIKGQPCRIHQICNEWPGIEAVVDLIDRNRRFLSARTTECAVDIAFAIDGGIRDGMQAIGNLNS